MSAPVIFLRLPTCLFLTRVAQRSRGASPVAMEGVEGEGDGNPLWP